MSKDGSITRFLNVDLDLRADSRLDDLIRGFGSSVTVLNNTTHNASLELSVEHDSVEETVLHFLDIIDALPPEAKSIWEQCEYRKLNIGIQGGSQPHEAQFVVSNKTVSLLGNAQLELVITVYGLAAD
jgi:hypothetical protein